MEKDILFLETEEKLKNYNFTKARIKAINQELELLENEIIGYRSPRYDDDIKSKSNQIYGLDDYLIQRERKKQKLLSEKRKKDCEIKKIENSLEVLNAAELKIIQFRYLNKNILTWNQISLKVGYCISQCKNLKIKAINKIKNII